MNEEILFNSLIYSILKIKNIRYLINYHTSIKICEYINSEEKKLYNWISLNLYNKGNSLLMIVPRNSKPLVKIQTLVKRRAYNQNVKIISYNPFLIHLNSKIAFLSWRNYAENYVRLIRRKEKEIEIVREGFSSSSFKSNISIKLKMESQI